MESSNTSAVQVPSPDLVNLTTTTATPQTSAYDISSFETVFIGAKIISAALLCIFFGAHGSLKRPPSASPPPKPSRPDHDDDTTTSTSAAATDEPPQDLYIAGLQASDAIVMPVVASAMLVGLYYLIQYLEDPDLLNKILRIYTSLVSIVSLSTLYAHAGQLLVSFVFPTRWRRGPASYAVNPTCRGHTPLVDSDAAPRLAHTSPFPQLSVLAHTPAPARAEALWTMRRVLVGDWRIRCKLPGAAASTSVSFKLAEAVGVLVALATVVTYCLYPVSALSNLVGFGSCYGIFMWLSPTSFFVGSLVLSGFFFYDIYMVFYTPFMVNVATKLNIPAQLTFKSSIGTNMLGLGDIILPGIVVCLALRFDHWRFYERQIRYEPVDLLTQSTPASTASSPTAATVVTSTEATHRAIKPEYIDVAGHWSTALWTLSTSPSSAFPKPYFWAAMGGYLLGLLVTLVVVFVFHAAQPALLYLVPGVVGALWLTGLVRGETRLMWTYTEDGSLDTTEVVVEVDGHGRVYKPLKKAADTPSSGTADDNAKGKDGAADGQKQKPKDGKPESSDDAVFFSLAVLTPRDEYKLKEHDE